MRVGIDQSLTSTGVVVASGDELVGFTVIKTNPKDWPNIHKRVDYIAKEISSFISAYEFESVTIEGLSYGSIGRATRDLAGLYYIICDRMFYEFGRKAYPNIITPTRLKWLATENGGAKKPEMFERLPMEVQQAFEAYGKSKYDLADAYWLATV